MVAAFQARYQSQSRKTQAHTAGQFSKCNYMGSWRHESHLHALVANNPQILAPAPKKEFLACFFFLFFPHAQLQQKGVLVQGC